MKINRLNLVWILRICWALAPVAAGSFILSAAAGDESGFSTAFSNTVEIGLWALWGLGAVCCLFLHSTSLALIRWLAPLGLFASCWAAVKTEDLAESTAAISFMVLIQVLAFSAVTGSSFIDAEAYGAEKRLLLKPPLFLQMFLLPLVWVVSAAGLLAGPLLLASEKWIAGMVLTPIGIVLFALGARSLYSLVRRQLIFAPGGIIVIDSLNLDSPMRIEKLQIKSFRAVRSNSTGNSSGSSALKNRGSAVGASGEDTLDLSLGTAGVAIEIELNSPVKAPVKAPHANFAYKLIRLAPTLSGTALECLKVH